MNSQISTPTVGFIGQGYIGKNYADVIEQRGYSVVRYAKEAPYDENGGKIAECDIVFVAVPTPTTPDGFDDSILRNVLEYVGDGKTAVIKSTLLPGTTARLQEAFPNIYIMHSPEFLREKHAAHDAQHPQRTIIGIPQETDEFQQRAQEVLQVVPDAPYERITTAVNAELIKYAGNAFLFSKVVFMNVLYELANEIGANFDDVAEAMAKDSRIGESHMQVEHRSGHLDAIPGRGAGGHCFIKDFAAFANLVEDALPTDAQTNAFIRALELKNVDLLRQSEKDLDLLEDVYGDRYRKS